MTVDSTQTTIQATLTGNAGETVTIPYLFFENGDLAVYVVDQTTSVVTVLTLDTDYSITGAGVSTGGELTIITTQTSGDTIHIDRWLDPLQETDYRETGTFPASSHETALDKLTMMIQQMLSRMGGSSHDPGFTEFMSRLSSDITKWDAQTSIIADLLDPTAAQHAATKAYVDAAINGAGDIVAPGNPGEDDYILVAGGGTFTWQNFKIPSPAVTTDDEKVLEATAAGGAGGYSWQDIGRLNFLINGGFRVNQRGSTYTAATSVLNSDDTSLLDRWRLLSDGNDVVDVSQDTAAANKPTGAYASLKSLVATANKKWGFVQILEARDAAALIGGTVSLSFDVIGSGISNVRAAILAWDSTADSVTSDVVSAWAAQGTNPTFATNWTAENLPANLAVTGSVVRHKIEGISIDTASAVNVAVFIWVDDTDASASDTLNISNVQLERSATAHAFVPRPIQEELALCQRYYSQSYDEGVFASPGSDTQSGMETFESAGVAGSHVFQFPVRMRAAPTVAVYDYIDGTVNRARNIADSDDATLAVQNAANGLGERSCHVRYSSGIDDTSYGFQWTADAEL